VYTFAATLVFLVSPLYLRTDSEPWSTFRAKCGLTVLHERARGFLTSSFSTRDIGSSGRERSLVSWPSSTNASLAAVSHALPRMQGDHNAC
jgi:hypothetical protein